MNKQDEILISKYLDGELSGDELKFVENLIIEDEEAALHYKMHQDTFSLLTKEYENPSYQAAKKRLKDLVTHHKAQTDTKTWSLEQIFPFSNLGSILSINNALVASFSLALAVIGLSFLNDDEIANSLEGFNTISLEKYKIEKSRSSDEELLNDDFQVVISSMLDKKVANMSVEYGAETFLISIEGVVYSDDDQTLCYKGKVFSKVNQSFVYCKKDEKSSLLITN